eukprot:CAMPEP_0167785302 /NCGR_PEP_ID=MMETSP0111_2-20121227/8158_1 /TAXON_ID=91324 /ORGANISM="Lotharella globosa, Strain CCCM811" /LENGTH=806 /DNA_ID=CAMNT_0007676551 /DNA_START=83 /DNA_END=2503 /DNA_ORIENTATION=+
MKVFWSNKGTEFDIKATSLDTISSLQEILATETKIPSHAQILLTADGAELNSGSRVGDLALQGSPAVYLFDRACVFEGAPADENMRTETYDPMVTSSTEGCFQLLNNASHSSSTANILVMYQKHFQDQRVQAKAFLESSGKRTKEAKSILRTSEIQMCSLLSAGNNLRHYYESMFKHFSNFKDDFDKIVERNKDLFETFERDLKDLRDVELHAALKTSKQKTLLDMLQEGELRSYLSKFRDRHTHLSQKVEELNLQLENVGSDVKSGNGSLDDELAKLQKQLMEATQTHVDNSIMTNDFVKDLDWINKKISAISESDLKDLITEISARDEKHCNALKRAHTNQQVPLHVLVASRQLGSKIRSHFYAKLAKISHLQTQVRSGMKKMALFKNMAEDLKRRHRKLSKIQQLPSIYSRCMGETKRRIAFEKSFTDLIANFQKKLEQHHREETERRRDFAKESMSAHFFPYLMHGPPKVDIHVDRKNSGKLPDVCDPQELESLKPRFADSLVEERKDPAEAQAMRDEVERLRLELNCSSAEITALKAENMKIAKAHAGAEESLRNTLTAKQTLEAMTCKLRAVEAEKASLEQQLNDAKQDSAATQNLAQVSLELSEVTKENESLKQRLRAKNDEMEKFHAVEQKLEDTEKALAKCQSNNAHLELLGGKIRDEKRALEGELRDMSMKMAMLLQEKRSLSEENSGLKAKQDNREMWKTEAASRIAYKGFQVNDTAIFFERKGFYVAFADGAPNCFLSLENQQMMKGKPKFAVGKIIHITRKRAESSNNSDNPYNLPIGTVYNELTVEVLKVEP